MAYQQDFTDDEEQKKQQGQGSEQVLTSESSSIGAGPTGTASAPKQTAKTGSGFTNLSQYVDANKGQAAGMADQVVQGVDQQAKATQDSAQAFKTDLSKRAQDATVKDQGVIGNLATAPSKFNEKQWQDLFKQQTTAYQGPQSVEAEKPYTDISRQYQNLDQTVKSLDSDQGRAQLAKSTFAPKDKQYNQGENLLDSFLLGTGAGAERLQQAGQAYKGQDFNKQWADITSGLNNQISQAKTTSAATNQATQNALKGAVGGLETKFAGYGQQVGQENAQKAQTFSNLQGQLASQDPSTRQEAYKALGIDAAQGEWLRSQGYDLGRLATQSGDRSLGDVAQDSEVADYNALLGLEGKQTDLNFAKSGNNVSPYAVNQQALDKSKSAMDLKTLLEGRLAEKQAARKQEYSTVRDAVNIPLSARYQKEGFLGNELEGFSKALGLSPEDYEYAAQKGFLNHSQVKEGTALNLGDVANDTDRQQWGQIMADLGITGESLQDVQDEGSAYGLDTAAIMEAIKASRAQEQARLDAIAEKEKPAIDDAIREEAEKVSLEASQPGRINISGGPKDPTPISDKDMDEQKKKGEDFITANNGPGFTASGQAILSRTPEETPAGGRITNAVRNAIKKAKTQTDPNKIRVV